MSITPHLALSVFLVLASASSTSGAVLDVPVTPLIVRLYGPRDVPPADSESALRETAEILAEAGLALQWMACPLNAAASHRCAIPLGSAELAVRLVTGNQQPSSSSSRPLPLGYSLVDGSTQGGSLATIYLDRVRWLASAATADLAALLGRAIAHEIGHLLLGTTQHGRFGVMRAIWSREAVRNSRSGEWRFSVHEARQLRAAVLARTATNQLARNSPLGD
jgi:hypothetical protein